MTRPDSGAVGKGALCAAGRVPANWNPIRAKFLYRERKEVSATGEEELLSASHITGITRRSEKDVTMFLAETMEGYKRVYSGDAVVNTMWAWMGALGVSFIEGIISPSYGVYMPIGQQRDHRYYDYLFRSGPFVAEINRRSKGVWSSRLRLYPGDFLDLRLPNPPVSVQESIADFLDTEVGRIDELIAKKHRLLSAVSQRIESLVGQAIASSDTPRIRFENVVRPVTRPVNLSEHGELVRLGLYNRGRGIFKKQAADEEGLGDSDFFFVKEGDLILSGQFAWEGAVALATANEEGCVVSHRYPVYRARPGVNTAYLLGVLRTSFGDFLLNESSRGAAGRNRPLNTWRLGKEKIPVPDDRLQRAVEIAVGLERRLKDKTDDSITRLHELKTALVTAAVTGQVDIASWRKRAETDRHLERIDESQPSRQEANA